MALRELLKVPFSGQPSVHCHLMCFPICGWPLRMSLLLALQAQGDRPVSAWGRVRSSRHPRPAPPRPDSAPTEPAPFLLPRREFFLPSKSI